MLFNTVKTLQQNQSTEQGWGNPPEAPTAEGKGVWGQSPRTLGDFATFLQK